MKTLTTIAIILITRGILVCQSDAFSKTKPSEPVSLAPNFYHYTYNCEFVGWSHFYHDFLWYNYSWDPAMPGGDKFGPTGSFSIYIWLESASTWALAGTGMGSNAQVLQENCWEPL